jgi:hypothetical protein
VSRVLNGLLGAVLLVAGFLMVYLSMYKLNVLPADDDARYGFSILMVPAVFTVLFGIAKIREMIHPLQAPEYYEELVARKMAKRKAATDNGAAPTPGE